jgi:hypothetical protein
VRSSKTSRRFGTPRLRRRSHALRFSGRNSLRCDTHARGEARQVPAGVRSRTDADPRGCSQAARHRAA